MKYIDADKLIAEIKRRQEQSRKMIGGQSRVQLCRQLLDFIEFLQHELPGGLDEAAKKYADEVALCDEVPSASYYEMVFKAGAIWMARQGETHETEVVSRVTEKGFLPAVTTLVDGSYKEGDKVIVQIRKK